MSARPSLGATGCVLVIEDDAGARDLLASALRLMGFHVRSAADGLGGLRVVDTYDPDVIVLDLGLPIASGFEVLHELRAAPRTRDTPVIAISGHDRGIALARENPEFFAVLTKPIDSDTLSAVVARALRLRGSGT